MAGGFIGSKAKTKEKTTTQQWFTEEHDTDTVTGGAEKSLTVGAGATVYTADDEIVEKALDFARFAYEEAGHNFGQTVETTRAAMAQSEKTVGEIKQAYATAEGKLDPTMVIIALGVILGLGLIFQPKRGR